MDVDPHRDPILSPFIEASFTCERCGNEAARIALVPRGGFDPTDVGREPVVDAPRYVIDAPGFGLSHALLPGGAGPSIPQIAAALADHDLRALWDLDPEYVPMWCPSCRAVYCAGDWTLWSVDADDLPGWFEELRGRCPAGHERRIYD